MRDLSSTSAMISARSVKVEPNTVPPPAMVSSNGITLEVARCAALRCLAIRAMADSRDEEPAAPGLREGEVSQGGHRRGRVKRTGSYKV